METKDLILDGHKLAWHADRVNAWLRGERIAPITIDCALTRKCNYRCIYCYGQLQANDEKRMNEKVICDFLDDIAEIGVKGISFVSDGESTCSPYLYKAILHAKSNGLDVGLGTNGSLLKKEKLEDILNALTWLRFNISAANPESYQIVHGCNKDNFYKVIDIIRNSVEIKKEKNLKVTLGLQMVLLPSFKNEIVPLAKLGRELGVDYFVIKHCSDDEFHTLGVNYEEYFQNDLIEKIKEAESFSTKDYLVKAKWSKILSRGEREYSKCYGPPFQIQLSGSGLVAPCGMLFNKRYKKLFHIGNITETRFKDIWKSERYWEVMNRLTSDEFDPRIDCGCLCLQHLINDYLWNLKKEAITKIEMPEGNPPQHVNFL